MIILGSLLLCLLRHVMRLFFVLTLHRNVLRKLTLIDLMLCVIISIVSFDVSSIQQFACSGSVNSYDVISECCFLSKHEKERYLCYVVIFLFFSFIGKLILWRLFNPYNDKKGAIFPHKPKDKFADKREKEKKSESFYGVRKSDFVITFFTNFNASLFGFSASHWKK